MKKLLGDQLDVVSKILITLFSLRMIVLVCVVTLVILEKLGIW